MNHQTRVYDSVLELLSSVDNPTPIVRLNRVVPFKHAVVYAKLEWYNPFGAVKDRVAANLLRDADGRGVKAGTLVEPTSGNTGMGLAMMANARRLPLTVTLSTAIPAEKRAVLRMFGAKLVELEDELCPMPGAPEGAMAKATELAQQPGWHQLNQYRNPANPDAHFRTTGPEVWRQTDGKITHFVAGLGTCGTITGSGRFLKSKNKAVKVLGVHPAEGHDIPGVRSLRQLKLADFFKPDEYDGLVEIDNLQAYKMCKRLNQEESLIAGPSSGMALAGALKLIPDEPGVIAVVMFPDNAFKYASSFRKHLPELFADAGKAAPPPPARAESDTIEIDEVAELVQSGQTPTFIDVRPPEIYQRAHVPGAINLPLGMMGRVTTGLPDDKDAPIVTICNRGHASISGMQALKSLGYRNVRSMNGGTLAWMDKGLPVER